MIDKVIKYFFTVIMLSDMVFKQFQSSKCYWWGVWGKWCFHFKGFVTFLCLFWTNLFSRNLVWCWQNDSVV